LVLNKKFFLRGILKFFRPKTFLLEKQFVVLIKFRFFRDLFLRMRAKRSYKYFRPEQKKYEKEKTYYRF